MCGLITLFIRLNSKVSLGLKKKRLASLGIMVATHIFKALLGYIVFLERAIGDCEA